MEIKRYRMYPQQQRELVLRRALEGDKTTKELSAEVGVPASLINRWKRAYLEEEARRVEEEAKRRKEDRKAALLDSFAGQAMQSLLRTAGPHFPNEIASKAYLCADNMLKTRKLYL